MSDQKLKLYGTNWCMKSAALRNHLQRQWIDFEDHNVEEDETAEQEVRALYDGKLKFPTVVYDGEHLKNPSPKELDDFLKKKSLD